MGGSHRIRPFACLVAIAIILAGCEHGAPGPRLERLTLAQVAFEDLPGWSEDSVAEALPALRRSCAKLASEPDESSAGPAGTALRVRDWSAACDALVGVGDGAAARSYFEHWFRPYRAGNNGAPEGLFTGYYEPELHGARERGGPYATPLYGRPGDLVTVDLGNFDAALRGKRIAGRVLEGALKPYLTRAEIEAGALDDTAPVLLWVDDPIDAFFLQIQGSGRVVLADGGMVRVGFAGWNGRAYRAIGKLLVERGAMTLEEASLQTIRNWLRAHPEEAKAVMDEDAAYVFFREVEGDGPIGAEGVVLTPGRSLAVDPRFIALGQPIWLDIDGPEPGKRLRRLVVAQDTGGAIKGPVRGDLFWGFGPEAEAIAGRMRARGEYYLLLPRPAAGEAGADRPGAAAAGNPG